jgi:hypothetical protein
LSTNVAVVVCFTNTVRCKYVRSAWGCCLVSYTPNSWARKTSTSLEVGSIAEGVFTWDVAAEAPVIGACGGCQKGGGPFGLKLPSG